MQRCNWTVNYHMPFEWHGHHFVTRTPCLDLANTIVWRNTPARTEDRISSRTQLELWVRACKTFDGLAVDPRGGLSLELFLQIRCAIDCYFRSGEGWAELVMLYAQALKDEAAGPEREILHGAVKLALSEQRNRVKVCGNCGWLFLDHTRNQNKRWCIATLCGNRTKARRYYAIKKQKRTQEMSGA